MGRMIHIIRYIHKPVVPKNNNRRKIILKTLGSMSKYTPKPPQTPAILELFALLDKFLYDMMMNFLKLN